MAQENAQCCLNISRKFGIKLDARCSMLDARKRKNGYRESRVDNGKKQEKEEKKFHSPF